MRNVIIAGACFLTLAATACKSDRKLQTNETTTTGANMPIEQPAGIEPEAPSSQVPMSAPAPAATNDIQLDQPADQATSQNTAPTGRVAAPDDTTRNVNAADGGRGDNSRIGTPIDPRDETLNPRKGNSFESSGGTSGLGIYGTSPQGGHDGGK